MARGALDERLKDFTVPRQAAEQVINEHDCSDQHACTACGYRPSKKQPVCPSQAIAYALIRGRAPRWHEPTPKPSTVQPEQDGLFPASRSTR